MTQSLQSNRDKIALTVTVLVMMVYVSLTSYNALMSYPLLGLLFAIQNKKSDG